MSRGEIRVDGLREFRSALRTFTADHAGKQQLKNGNRRVAELVASKVQALASTKMERKAADTIKPANRADGVYVIGGSKDVPYFGGANFGAHRDVLRILKADRIKKGDRGRATMVREDQASDPRKLNKVILRIEQQSVTSTGKVAKKGQGVQVRVARTKAGGVRTMRGWNQFKPWTKGQDYMLYRSIKNNIDEIVALYFKELERLTKQAFPD
jgi:hypothetical protein